MQKVSTARENMENMVRVSPSMVVPVQLELKRPRPVNAESDAPSAAARPPTFLPTAMLLKPADFLPCLYLKPTNR